MELEQCKNGTKNICKREKRKDLPSALKQPIKFFSGKRVFVLHENNETNELLGVYYF